MNPLQKTVGWLAQNTLFPASRLETKAELLLCMQALAEAEQAGGGAGARHPLQRHEPGAEAALKAHAMRRSLVHYKCDNSAKV